MLNVYIYKSKTHVNLIVGLVDWFASFQHVKF